MANTWTFDQPNVLVFENTSKLQKLTIAKVDVTDPNSEWSANLVKNGVDKGTIKLDALADFKDLFTQVGAEL
jgi:hypothetical protein